MTFWFVVLVALIGVPCVLFISGMGMIFAAAGHANGGDASRGHAIVVGWVAFAWLLVGAFGAFGLAPTWRAWHGGAENFDGGLRLYVDWLAGVGIVGALALMAYRRLVTMDRDQVERSPLLDALRWVLLSLGMAPYAALGAWIIWPLVSWPMHGHFAWPDARTGWTHTAGITAVLVAAMVAEVVVRKLRKPRKRED